MIDVAADTDRRDLPFIALVPFLIIAFAIAWGILGLFNFAPHLMTWLFGQITGRHPLFIVAVYAPALAAISVVLWFGGSSGLRHYLTRLLMWRTTIGWYSFLLLGIPLIFFAGAAVKGNLFGTPFPFAGMAEMLAAMGFMLILGPVEELGWRGVALPLLLRQFVPVWAGMVLGPIWGVWHLPAFFLSGTPQSGWGFMPFFAGSVAISVILTPLFNSSRGSILIPALFHFQLNNPVWPDAQPYDTIFFVLAALATTWINRDTMFESKSAATDVMPRHKRSGTSSKASLPR